MIKSMIKIEDKIDDWNDYVMSYWSAWECISKPSQSRSAGTEDDHDYPKEGRSCPMLTKSRDCTWLILSWHFPNLIYPNMC